MSRLRERPGNIAYSAMETDFKVVNYPTIFESFSESFYPGSTPCVHSKIGNGSAAWVFPDSYPPNVRGKVGTMKGNFMPENLGFSSTLDNGFGEALQRHTNSLNWRKLDSSSSASLIQTLAEMDETLLIFTRKFWAQLNYGAFTWGIVPFVKDVCAWSHTVSRALRAINGAESNRYRNASTFAYTNSDLMVSNNWTLKTSVQIELSRSGNYTLSGIQKSLQWLDRLGFHPDLATAYDLVPLSFAVDYFLPIGEFLTNLFQRGWVNEISYNGWLSYNSEYKYTFGNPEIKPHWASATGSQTYSLFTRGFDSSVLHTEPVRFDIPEFSLPTLLQIFNTQYLVITRSGRKAIKRDAVNFPSKRKR